VGFEKEVTTVQQLHLRIRTVPLEVFRPGRNGNDIVFPPDRKRRDLAFPEVALKLRIELDIGPVVFEILEPDIFVAGPGNQSPVEMVGCRVQGICIWNTRDDVLFFDVAECQGVVPRVSFMESPPSFQNARSGSQNEDSPSSYALPF
jgi:hypothetical protein